MTNLHAFIACIRVCVLVPYERRSTHFVCIQNEYLVHGQLAHVRLAHLHRAGKSHVGVLQGTRHRELIVITWLRGSMTKLEAGIDGQHARRPTHTDNVNTVVVCISMLPVIASLVTPPALNYCAGNVVHNGGKFKVRMRIHARESTRHAL